VAAGRAATEVLPPLHVTVESTAPRKAEQLVRPRASAELAAELLVSAGPGGVAAAEARPAVAALAAEAWWAAVLLAAEPSAVAGPAAAKPAVAGPAAARPAVAGPGERRRKRDRR